MEGLYEQAREQAELAVTRARAAQTQLAERRVSFVRPGTAVTATVDGNGQLIQVDIAEGTLDHLQDVGAFQRELVTAINGARRKAAVQAADLLAPLVGGASPFERILGRSEYDSLLNDNPHDDEHFAEPDETFFPDTPSNLYSPPTRTESVKPRRRVIGSVDDDEYFEEMSNRGIF